MGREKSPLVCDDGSTNETPASLGDYGRVIAEQGVEAIIDRFFGPDGWCYDERERLWIVPRTQDARKGLVYYCFNAQGECFVARLPAESLQ